MITIEKKPSVISYNEISERQERFYAECVNGSLSDWDFYRRSKEIIEKQGRKAISEPEFGYNGGYEYRTISIITQ